MGPFISTMTLCVFVCVTFTKAVEISKYFPNSCPASDTSTRIVYNWHQSYGNTPDMDWFEWTGLITVVLYVGQHDNCKYIVADTRRSTNTILMPLWLFFLEIYCAAYQFLAVSKKLWSIDTDIRRNTACSILETNSHYKFNIWCKHQ